MTNTQNLPMQQIHLDEETLHALVDGALDAHKTAQAVAHLAACAACTARRDALVRLNAQLRALPELPVERDLRTSVLAALAARRAPAPNETLPRRWSVILIAQICALLALLAWIAPAGAHLALPSAADAFTQALAIAAPFGRLVETMLDSLTTLAAWPARATRLSAQFGMAFWFAALMLWALVNSAAWFGRNHLRTHGASRNDT